MTMGDDTMLDDDQDQTAGDEQAALAGADVVETDETTADETTVDETTADDAAGSVEPDATFDLTDGGEVAEADEDEAPPAVDVDSAWMRPGRW